MTIGETNKRGGKDILVKGDEVYERKKGVMDEVITEIIFSESKLVNAPKIYDHVT
jgi:hypothetical protein